METVSLVKIAKINMGQSPLSESYNNVGNGLPFFQGKADFGDVHPRVRVFCTSPNKIAEANDILLSVRAPVGSINICKTKSCIGRGLAAIRATSEIEQKYLYHFLHFYEPHLSQIGKGSTFEAVNREDVENIQIPLPKPNEQKRIAAILDKADRLRRQRHFAQTLSDSFLQSVFIEMFGDPGNNPKGWTKLPIEQLLSKDRTGIRTGPFGSSLKRYEYVAEGIPVWGINNVNPNEFVADRPLHITEKKYRELKNYKVSPGDILISRAGTVGRMCVANPKTSDSIIGTNLILVVLDLSIIRPDYFTALFTYFPHRAGSLRTSGDENAYSFLNPTNLRRITISVPPTTLQETFTEIVRKFERVRRQQREATRQAEHLFQTLLHRAFTGEL
jgi:type I restriction enzyme, S subunit